MKGPTGLRCHGQQQLSVNNICRSTSIRVKRLKNLLLLIVRHTTHLCSTHLSKMASEARSEPRSERAESVVIGAVSAPLQMAYRRRYRRTRYPRRRTYRRSGRRIYRKTLGGRDKITKVFPMHGDITFQIQPGKDHSTCSLFINEAGVATSTAIFNPWHELGGDPAYIRYASMWDTASLKGVKFALTPSY